MAAILLRLLLAVTFKLEHIVAAYFKKTNTRAAKIYRGICSYLILVIYKFVMLGAIGLVFGDAVIFGGPLHVVVSFVVVVVVIAIVVERNFLRILDYLEDD